MIKTLALAIYFTFSFALYASADPANWSESDNRCPKVSDKFKREVSTVSGLAGTYYVCYWFDNNNNVHNLAMRPINILGGFNRATTHQRGKHGLIKQYLLQCAQDYVEYLGFCGEV